MNAVLLMRCTFSSSPVCDERKSGLPAQEGRAIGKAAAKGIQQYNISRLHATGTIGLIKGNWNGRRRRITVIVKIDKNPVCFRNPQPLGRCVDNATIGLVGDQQRDI